MKNHTTTLQSWHGPGHGEGPATQRTQGAHVAVLCRQLPHPSILWHCEACGLLLPLQAGVVATWTELKWTDSWPFSRD